MYLECVLDQIHWLFNESKKSIFSINRTRVSINFQDVSILISLTNVLKLLIGIFLKNIANIYLFAHYYKLIYLLNNIFKYDILVI